MDITVGRVVHFVTEKLQHRPAIVVQTWGVPVPPHVNLIVFYDAPNDRPECTTEAGSQWVGSVREDPTGETARSWHWPERA